ncbi:hypothetical protein V8J36_22125 [Frigidibacter sp. MR17.14]|uniref:hypothetical protein n=1 Tax=Frigidibacter sp. MR17.14 TaxID=3126509 RepID=UPI003012E19B
MARVLGFLVDRQQLDLGGGKVGGYDAARLVDGGQRIGCGGRIAKAGVEGPNA